jgi:hypothetical protein
MCPACDTNIALVAAGATSSGGVTALVLRKFFRRERPTSARETKVKLQEIETETETNPEIGSRSEKDEQ